MIKKIAAFLIIGYLTAFFAEAGWSFFQSLNSKNRPIEVRPVYPWSFHTLSGKRIGHHGYLKLGYHPFVQYINFPNQKALFFKINSLGFRGDEIHKEKKTKKRIIVIGGSAAFGAGAWSDAETFPAHLQKLFPDAEVINAAAIGHVSGNELVYLTNELVDLQPDLVIAFDGYNDLAGQFYDYPRDPHTLGANVVFFRGEGKILKMKFAHSPNFLRRVLGCQPFIFNKISFALRELHEKIKGEPTPLRKMAELYDAHPEIYEKRMRDIVETYVRNTAKMNTISEVFGARFVSIRQPHSTFFFKGPNDYWIRAKDLKDFFGRLNRRMEEEKIMQLDLNDPKTGFTRGSFIDNLHLTDEGAALAAALTAQYIQKQHLLDPPAPVESLPSAAPQGGL